MNSSFNFGAFPYPIFRLSHTPQHPQPLRPRASGRLGPEFKYAWVLPKTPLELVSPSAGAANHDGPTVLAAELPARTAVRVGPAGGGGG